LIPIEFAVGAHKRGVPTRLNTSDESSPVFVGLLPSHPRISRATDSQKQRENRCNITENPAEDFTLIGILVIESQYNLIFPISIL
jgi:hypothetical protein